MKAQQGGRDWIGVERRARARLLVGCAVALVQMLAAGTGFGAAPSGGEPRTSAAEATTEAAAPARTRIDLTGRWRFKGDWEENGLAEGWQGREFDDSDWRELYVPGCWEEQGVITANPRWRSTEPNDGYNGLAWYRRHFTVPADWGRDAVKFRSGGIDDMDWTFVNGTLVGSTTEADAWDWDRDYLIPADLLKPGEDNVIAIRVCDTGGEGGIRWGPVEIVNVVAAAAETARARATTERAYPERRQELVKIGGGIEVPATTMVYGNAVAVGGSADVKGYVRGDVVAIGGNVHAHPGARIDGDAVSIGGIVVQEGDTHIGGSVVEGRFLPGQEISQIVSDALGHKLRHPFRVWPFGWLRALGRAGAFLSKLLFWGIVTTIVVLLFPKRLEVMARALPAEPGRAAAYGIGGLVVTWAAVGMTVLVGIALCVMLAAIVIGIPLIPVVVVGVLAAILILPVLVLLGTVAIWLSLGRAAAARVGVGEPRAIWAALLGLLLVSLVALIPNIGPLIGVTLLIFGFGVALMTGMGADPEWAHRKLGLGRRSQAAVVQEPPSAGESAEDGASPGPPEGHPQQREATSEDSTEH